MTAALYRLQSHRELFDEGRRWLEGTYWGSVVGCSYWGVRSRTRKGWREAAMERPGAVAGPAWQQQQR